MSDDNRNIGKIRWNGQFSLGDVIGGILLLTGVVGIYTMQARTDERQDAAIDAATSRVDRLESSGARADNAIAQIQQTLARIDGRMEGVVQGQQRLERALEVRQ